MNVDKATSKSPERKAATIKVLLILAIILGTFVYLTVSIVKRLTQNEFINTLVNGDNKIKIQQITMPENQQEIPAPTRQHQEKQERTAGQEILRIAEQSDGLQKIDMTALPPGLSNFEIANTPVCNRDKQNFLNYIKAHPETDAKDLRNPQGEAFGLLLKGFNDGCIKLKALNKSIDTNRSAEPPVEDTMASQPVKNNMANQPAFQHSKCTAASASRTTAIFDYNTMQRDDIPNGTLSVNNRHPANIVIILTSTESAKKLASITVAPGDTGKLKLPGGHYGMILFTGMKWCNNDTGFIDGKTINIVNGTTIEPNATNNTIIVGNIPGQVALSFSYEYQTDETSNDGLNVFQDRNGNYFTSGKINGMPVKFHVDTGATFVSISTALARELGITRCGQAMQYTTANGKAMGCMVTVGEIAFGPFRVKNVQVNIMQNMTPEPLLGMNVLNRFNIAANGKTLKITSKSQ